MRALVAIVSLAALVSVGGCIGIYGEISDLEDEAWVHESGAPADVNSNDYGIGFGFGGSAGSGVKFLAFGQTPGGVGLLSFDEAGRLSSTGNPIPAGFEFIENPPTAGLASAIANNRNVVIGANEGSAGGVILYSPNGLESQVDVLNVTGNVVGVGIGTTAGGDANVDVVASHGNELTIFDDYIEPGSTCTLVNDMMAPVAAGRLVLADFDSNGRDEIVVMAGGELRIYSAEPIIGGTAPITCEPAGSLTGIPAGQSGPAPGGEADFGALVIVGNFNNTGGPDVVATAPSSGTVYVFLDGNLSAPIAVTADSSSADFAAAVAAGDLDNDGQDELIIGAPETSVDGTGAAGHIEVRQFSGGAFGAPIFFRRSQPESNERYGRALGVASFNDNKDLLLVGADQKVFVNFRHPIAGDDEDPRR